MDFIDLNNIVVVPDDMVYCPIFGKEICEGLCWELANLNIGDGKMQLSADEIPPCGWKEARKMCDKCPDYC